MQSTTSQPDLRSAALSLRLAVPMHKGIAGSPARENGSERPYGQCSQFLVPSGIRDPNIDQWPEHPTPTVINSTATRDHAGGRLFPSLFEIDEITENPVVTPQADMFESWKPSKEPGANTNLNVGVGTSGKQFLCDPIRIYEVQRPSEAQIYSTFSVDYSVGVGFWVLKGDERQPPDSATWQPLQFGLYDANSCSSCLTDAGQSQRIRLQLQDGAGRNYCSRVPTMLTRNQTVRITDD
jgi:hypothetical protein